MLQGIATMASKGLEPLAKGAFMERIECCTTPGASASPWSSSCCTTCRA